MKLTDFTFPSGMPLSREWAAHQQAGYVEALGATYSALCAPTDGFIVSGCVFPAVTGAVTDGWVYLNREFFYFPGDTVTIPLAANLCFVIDDDPAASPLASAVYSDGVTRAPFRDRKVRLEVATSGIRLPVATRQYFANIVSAAEPWRLIGALGQPAFLNSFTSTSAAAAFRKAGDIVQLAGAITNPSLSPVLTYVAAFTLPVGYRPATDLSWRLTSDLELSLGIGQYCKVQPGGQVLIAISDTSITTNTLDGISFRI